jgi:hypothetical protein
MRSPRHTLRPLRQDGQITWVGVLLLLVLAAGAYAAVVLVPVYALHYQVLQVVRDFGNQAIKERDDALLVSRMAQKIRSLDAVVVEDEHGRPQREPVVDLRPEDVTWTRDTSVQPPLLHVSFEYVREVELPWLDRTIEKPFEVDLTLDLERPDWGAAR